MRIVFMGTPDFAVPCLAELLEAGHQVCGVFTQPDKPKGRKMDLPRRRSKSWRWKRVCRYISRRTCAMGRP